MALTTDEPKSALDVMAEGSINDQLNETPEETPEAPVVDEKETAREARLVKLEAALLESQQEAQFMRGFIQSQQRHQQQPVAEPEDKDEEIDYDAVSKDIEARGSKALHEFIAKEVAKGVKIALKESGKVVDQRLGADRAANARTQQFRAEIEEISTEFPGFMQDEDFKGEADKEAIKILTMRLGRAPSGPEDNRYYQPGDLMAAVSRVALRRERANKQATPAKTSSLREITQRVPVEQLGGRNGKINAQPKSIDDLDMTDKEKSAARNVYRKLKDLNPDLPLSEERWVKSYIAGQRENEEAA